MSVRRIPPTPLQVAHGQLRELLADTRQSLVARQWNSFIAIACDAIGHEAARNITADLLGEPDNEKDEAA